MRKIFSVLSLVLCSLIMVSCFKEKSKNSEADILSAQLKLNDTAFYQASNAIIKLASSDTVISFKVRPSVNISSLAPTFILSKGASISPKSGSIQDFSKNAVRYTVTSEDKKYKRVYSVIVDNSPIFKDSTLNFNFSDYSIKEEGLFIKNKCYVWNNPKQFKAYGFFWFTPNAGYAQGGMYSTEIDKYPAVPYFNSDKQQEGISLTTSRLGALAASFVPAPIAAGSIFIGTAQLAFGADDILKKTFFGVPFPYQVQSISGEYMYSPGKTIMTPQGVKAPYSIDQADIYAIFYKNTDNNGKKYILTAYDIKSKGIAEIPEIVAVARVDSLPQCTEWKSFKADFIYTKKIDPKVLSKLGYNLTIVMTASKQGSYFIGAVGSNLKVKSLSLSSKIAEK